MCKLAAPAQIACAECAGCARVAGELRSRRATEIYVLTSYAPSGRQACSAEVLVRLMSPRACRCTSLEAGDGYTAKPLAVLRAHVWSIVPRRVPWQCMTACRIGVVLCVSVALERGWRGRNVHGDGILVRPSCLYIISTICNRLDA